MTTVELKLLKRLENAGIQIESMGPRKFKVFIPDSSGIKVRESARNQYEISFPNPKTLPEYDVFDEELEALGRRLQHQK